MTEKLFLKVNDAITKKAIATALTNEIATNKHCYIYTQNGEKVASFSKYEILRDGLSFDLEEAIPDYIVEERGMVKSISLKDAIISHNGKSIAMSMVKEIIA